MKSIIITGPQGSGKTTLAKLIAENRNPIFISNNLDLKEFSEGNGCIVFDGISSDADIELFKDLSSKTSILIRKPFTMSAKRFEFKDVILIGVFQEKPKNVRHSEIFNLSK